RPGEGPGPSVKCRRTRRTILIQGRAGEQSDSGGEPRPSPPGHDPETVGGAGGTRRTRPRALTGTTLAPISAPTPGRGGPRGTIIAILYLIWTCASISAADRARCRKKETKHVRAGPEPA